MHAILTRDSSPSIANCDALHITCLIIPLHKRSLLAACGCLDCALHLEVDVSEAGVHEALFVEGVVVVLAPPLEFYLPQPELVVELQLHLLLLLARVLHYAPVLVVEQELEVHVRWVEGLDCCLRRLRYQVH